MAVNLLIFVFVVLCILLLFTFITYWITFFMPPFHKEDIYALPKGEQYEREKERMFALIRDMDAVPYEAVTISSYDGLKLAAKYYHVEDGAPLEIQCHGYRGNGVRDFCGGNKLARNMGHNTLVIDERAHGKSEGHTITFGIRERRDCLSWIQYACERFGTDTKIILSGVSMGAATVLMASELNLPENVVGIIADSPYSSPEAIIRKVCGDMKMPQQFVFPFISFGAKLFGHFNIRKASAEKAIQHTKLPILLLHGEDDRFVPCEMSKKMARMAPEQITCVTFPDAGHGLSFIADKERYKQVVQEFVEKIL